MTKDAEIGIKTLRIPQLNGSLICIDYSEECVNMAGFKEALSSAIGQQDIKSEFREVINNNFWELL